MSYTFNYQFDVFISYSRHDETTVDKLMTRLEADGFHLRIDTERTGGGDSLPEAIVQSRYIIVCLSPAYSGTRWSVVEEALDLAQRQRRLIPVQIALGPISVEYSPHHLVDLTDPRTWEEGYQKLAEHLRSSMEKEQLPTQDLASHGELGRPSHESLVRFGEGSAEHVHRGGLRQWDSSPLTHRTASFPPPSPQLATLGFRYHPFAFFEAEKMRPEILEETFVAHPGFDDHIKDLHSSAVLLAPRGGGKTAGRLRLEVYLNQLQQQAFAGWPLEDGSVFAPLVVVYKNFEKIVEHPSDVDLHKHTKPLLSSVAEAVYNLITTYPERFEDLNRLARDWWWAFLAMYLEGESLTYRMREGPLAEDWSRETERPALFHPNSTLQSILEGVQKRLAGLNLTTLFILVDEVDGYIETQPLAKMEALVAPLLNSLPLLSLSGTVWKFFLPDTLEKMALHSTGYETARLNLVTIRWNESSLRKLLSLRLAWASNGRIQDIAQLCDQEMSNVDIEQELVELAFRHSRLGPPRALLELGQYLLKVSEGHISHVTWQHFKERFAWIISSPHTHL